MAVNMIRPFRCLSVGMNFSHHEIRADKFIVSRQGKSRGYLGITSFKVIFISRCAYETGPKKPLFDSTHDSCLAVLFYVQRTRSQKRRRLALLCLND